MLSSSMHPHDKISFSSICNPLAWYLLQVDMWIVAALRQIVGSSDSPRRCKNTDLNRNYYCLSKFIPTIMWINRAKYCLFKFSNKVGVSSRVSSTWYHKNLNQSILPLILKMKLVLFNPCTWSLNSCSSYTKRPIKNAIKTFIPYVKMFQLR